MGWREAWYRKIIHCNTLHFVGYCIINGHLIHRSEHHKKCTNMSYNVIICIGRSPIILLWSLVCGTDVNHCAMFFWIWLHALSLKSPRWKGKSHSARSKRTSVRTENNIVVAVVYLPHVQWGLSFRCMTWTPCMGNIVNKQLRTMKVDGLPNEVVAS